MAFDFNNIKNEIQNLKSKKINKQEVNKDEFDSLFKSLSKVKLNKKNNECIDYDLFDDIFYICPEGSKIHVRDIIEKLGSGAIRNFNEVLKSSKIDFGLEAKDEKTGKIKHQKIWLSNFWPYLAGESIKDFNEILQDEKMDFSGEGVIKKDFIKDGAYLFAPGAFKNIDLKDPSTRNKFEFKNGKKMLIRCGIGLLLLIVIASMIFIPGVMPAISGILINFGILGKSLAALGTIISSTKIGLAISSLAVTFFAVDLGYGAKLGLENQKFDKEMYVLIDQYKKEIPKSNEIDKKQSKKNENDKDIKDINAKNTNEQTKAKPLEIKNDKIMAIEKEKKIKKIQNAFRLYQNKKNKDKTKNKNKDI